ncbi:MAG: hypothetical protein DMD55_00335 [Gemmatimonadetes bacterium]|nr:MAG: hypothetical protein DMD55_00335 [Gemmatimonadota bacterium]
MRPLVLLRTLIATKLGTCALCIRLSLMLSLSSWAGFAALALLVPGSLAANLALVPALAFTTLFAGHVIAYAVRVGSGYRNLGKTACAGSPDLAANRRRFLVVSAQTIALTIVPTALASALYGSIAGAGICPQPSGCINSCCCKNCRTQLPKCDPNHDSCRIFCFYEFCVPH